MSSKKKRLDQSQQLQSEAPSLSATDSNIMQPEGKPPNKSKGKHKKRICVIIILVFLVIYYLFIKFLRPEEQVQKVGIVEGEIKFNSSLSKNYTWIQQKLDHLSQDQRTWNQRLLINIEGPITKTTPVLLSVPNLIPPATPQLFENFKQLCKDQGCLQISLEPRYFGESRPLGDQSYTTENLQFLTLEQMVEDIAYLINRISNHHYFGLTTDNPWMLAGKSLGAVVPLLARAKYPELTVGVYVSSPLTLQPLAPEISERLYQIALSGGKKCRIVIEVMMAELQEKVSGDQKEGFLLEMGQGTSLKSEEALYLFMDRIRSIDRASFIGLCSSLDEDALFQELKPIFFFTTLQLTDPLSYSVSELTSPEEWSYFQSLRNRRAHEWLRCSQFGLFESYPTSDKKHINFKLLDEAYFRLYCYKLFGKNVWPSPQRLQKITQDLKMITNAFVVHGYYDIWLPYGWIPEPNKDVQVETVRCSSCSHDFDSLIEKAYLEEVDSLRKKEKQTIHRWFKN